MHDASRPSDPLPIRPLSTVPELRAIEELQREVWGFDDVEVVPLHVLMTSVRHGGQLLGAFDGDRIVGFSFGFRGVDVDGTAALCSHLLAVAPAARGQGLGIALKWAQRAESLRAGIGRILWTYDPLEHGNARLNLGRLGGVSNRYLDDLYGELRDALNAGLPTDRIEVVWDLNSPRVRARAGEPYRDVSARGEGAGRATANGSDDPGPRLDDGAPSGAIADPGERIFVRLSAPADAQTLRRREPDAARAWRLHLRAGMHALFERGYLLVDADADGDGPDLRFARAEAVPVMIAADGATADRPTTRREGGRTDRGHRTRLPGGTRTPGRFVLLRRPAAVGQL
ncbi:MAG: hypothetical protein U5J97_04265 [Trueperaceae bacterium]|nr:hypothetical protein [Trueperaceae bacterium]